MTQDNDASGEPAIFSALITPHRSLGATGFVVLMAVLGLASFIAGMVFLLAGAWPVVGFLGLDVLLVWWAFRANYRSATAYELVRVTASELTVRKVGHRGDVREWTLNPLWVCLERESDAEFGLRELFLTSRGHRLPVASFLAPAERESFATALTEALSQARRGPTRTALA